ncbi:hypothetical protein [Mycoplasma sp. Mirounga ES2805-ORL]|nr:hypothetical protein [Mycoplasma sp. Mirounga ES2805-ORL]
MGYASKKIRRKAKRIAQEVKDKTEDPIVKIVYKQNIKWLNER